MISVERSKVLTAAGRFDIARAEVAASAAARLWDVQVWIPNAAMYAQWFNATGATMVKSLGACLILVNVDGQVQQSIISGTAVAAANHWLPLSPRGARLTVVGRVIDVSIKIATYGQFLAPSPSFPLSVAARITEVSAAPPQQRSVHVPPIAGLHAPATVHPVYQLPMFTTEFRVHGASTDSIVYLYDGTFNTADGSPRVLKDPESLVTYEYLAGDVQDWTPLHPWAAAIGFGAAPIGFFEVR